jgi:hypothetical protein
VRLYDPTSRYHPGPRTFRRNGPRLRFDHHRAAPDGSPTNDPKRGVYYAALTISCALVEVFGDGGVIERVQWRLALSRLRDPLQLVDLRGAAAMRVAPWLPSARSNPAASRRPGRGISTTTLRSTATCTG